MCVGGYAFTAARSYNTSASVKLHLTMQMMQMKKNTSLTSPAAQKSQKITSNTTSKTLLPCTPKHHVISSLRSALSGQPPQTHFVRQTQLSWRLLRRLAFVIYIYISGPTQQYRIYMNLHLTLAVVGPHRDSPQVVSGRPFFVGKAFQSAIEGFCCQPCSGTLFFPQTVYCWGSILEERRAGHTHWPRP